MTASWTYCWMETPCCFDACLIARSVFMSNRIERVCRGARSGMDDPFPPMRIRYQGWCVCTDFG